MEDQGILIHMRRYFLLLAVIICSIEISACCSIPKKYEGQVIDADTKEPIEGVHVWASWRTERGDIAGTQACGMFQKDTYTDENGKWELVGPSGCEEAPWNKFLSFISCICYTKYPWIGVKKSGYTGEFMAFPYIEPVPFPYMDWSKHYKGIVLFKKHESKEDRVAYYKKYGANTDPLILIDNPGKRIKSLDFPFDYPSDESRIVAVIVDEDKSAFMVYTVVGLKK